MSDSRPPTGPAPLPLVRWLTGPDRSPLWAYALAVVAVGLVSLAIAGLEQLALQSHFAGHGPVHVLDARHPAKHLFDRRRE